MSLSLESLRSDLERSAKVLISRIKQSGIQDPGSSSMFQDVVLDSNSLAMRNNTTAAFNWLTKASKLTDQRSFSLSATPSSSLFSGPGGASIFKGPTTLPGLRILTLNNIACFYKHVNELSLSLQTLQTALSESALDADISSQQRAVTHSNMSAVLSSLDKHEGARKHAKLAVQCCKDDLKHHSEAQEFVNDQLAVEIMNGDESDGGGADNYQPRGEGDQVPLPNSKQINRTVSALAVACYNLAVETEFCHSGEKALGWYKRSAELVNVVAKSESMGGGEPELSSGMMRQKIVKSYMEAKKKFGMKKANLGKANAQQTQQQQQQQQQQSLSRTAGSGINAIRNMRGGQRGNEYGDAMPASGATANSSDYDKVRAAVMSRSASTSAVGRTAPPFHQNDSVLVGEELSGDQDGGDVLMVDDDEDEELEIEKDVLKDGLGGGANSPGKKNGSSSYRPRSAGDARFGGRNKAGDGGGLKITRPRTAAAAGRAAAAVSAVSASVPTTPLKSQLIAGDYVLKTPEQSAMELAEKIEMMDQLASEARQKLQEINQDFFSEEQRGGGAKVERSSKKTKRRPKSAVEPDQRGGGGGEGEGGGGITTPQHLHQHQQMAVPAVATFSPLNPTDWLHGAKERNSGNIKKLIDQRDATQKLVVDRERELKAVKFKLGKQTKEQEDNEDASRRTIGDLREKTVAFDAEQAKLQENCDAIVRAKEEAYASIVEAKEKCAFEKETAELTAIETNRKYIECCEVLAKEKLLKREEEVKVAQGTKMALSAKGAKTMQMLVSKQTIEGLRTKLAEGKAHEEALDTELRKLNAKNSELGKGEAKNKLQARLSKLRTPEIGLDMDAISSSPLSPWFGKEAQEEEVAAIMDNNEIKGKGKEVGDVSVYTSMKVQGLADHIDFLEGERGEGGGGGGGGKEGGKEGGEEEVRKATSLLLNEIKVTAMEIEIDEISQQLMDTQREVDEVSIALKAESEKCAELDKKMEEAGRGGAGGGGGGGGGEEERGGKSEEEVAKEAKEKEEEAKAKAKMERQMKALKEELKESEATCDRLADRLQKKVETWGKAELERDKKAEQNAKIGENMAHNLAEREKEVAELRQDIKGMNEQIEESTRKHVATEKGSSGEGLEQLNNAGSSSNTDSKLEDMEKDFENVKRLNAELLEEKNKRLADDVKTKEAREIEVKVDKEREGGMAKELEELKKKVEEGGREGQEGGGGGGGGGEKLKEVEDKLAQALEKIKAWEKWHEENLSSTWEEGIGEDLQAQESEEGGLVSSDEYKDGGQLSDPD